MPLSESTAEDPDAMEEVRSLGQGLAEAGHRIILVRAGSTGADPESTPEEWEGFPLYRLPWSGGAKEGLPILHDEILKQHFSSLVGRERVDLVHCMDYRPFTAAMTDLCRPMNLPRLVTLNDLWFWCPRADRVLPDGRFCAARIHPGPGCRVCLMGQQEFVPAAGWMGGMARLAGKGMDTLRSLPAATGNPATAQDTATVPACIDTEGFETTIKQFNTDDLNRVDAGGIIGLGYQLKKNPGIAFAVKYYEGFANVYKGVPGRRNRSFFIAVTFPIGAGEHKAKISEEEPEKGK